MPQSIDLTQLLKELIQIGIDLTSERDLSVLLNRILTEARRFTLAEAGTLFLREGDKLHFAVVQNDALAARLGEAAMTQTLQAEPLPVNEESLAGYVASTGEVVNLPNAYDVPPGRSYVFNAHIDERTDYRTRSVLVVPLQDTTGNIVGVLQLINALDGDSAVVPFHAGYEYLLRSLASLAAVAIRNARLEELSFKDGLTNVYNRRYFMLRLEEEVKRHARFGEPVSLVLIDLDRFKELNDQLGHAAGDDALREVSRLLQKYSRAFTVITRYGGDEFAILLVNTPKAGAVTYAQRIRSLIEQHPFTHGPLTISLGVASLPEDVAAGADLMPAADKALYEAKRAGRNTLGVL